MKNNFLLKDRRGILLKEGVLTLIAIIGIGILVYFVISFAGIFLENTKLQQAEISLDKISSAVEKVNAGGEEVLVMLESPSEWWISAWVKGDSSMPTKCTGKYCVCLCEVKDEDFLGSGSNKYLENCDLKNKGYCKDFLVEIKTEGGKSISVGRGENFIPINPMTSLKIYKSGEEIIIKNEK